MEGRDVGVKYVRVSPGCRRAQERMEPLLPEYAPQPKPVARLPLRNVANGIFYVLCTGAAGESDAQ